jgi:tetratricopeptide (TPR) repeat protein
MSSAARVDETFDAELTLRHAVEAYRGGKMRETETLCRRILRQQPDHIAGLQLLGAVTGQTGRPNLGVQLLRKVIALRPTDVSGHIQLGNLLRRDGRLTEAAAVLRTALELQPDSSAAHNDLGLLHLHEKRLPDAAACFRRAIAVAPGFASAHYNLGLTLEEQTDNAGAIECYRQVAAIDPNFAEAHLALGILLRTEGKRSEALDCLRRAAAARPGSVFALLCEARVLTDEDKTDAAEELARRAIALDPRSSDAHYRLGAILMQAGRFNDAAASFDLAVALDERQIGAYHALAHVRKLVAADRPLIIRMTALLERPDIGDSARANLHFAIAKSYDDLGEYDNAIKHLDQANEIKHRFSAPYKHANHAAAVDRMITRFTADFFGASACRAAEWEGAVLVVGMPRSGTTLVEQILSSHPGIAGGGELSFWGERSRGPIFDATGQIDPEWAAETARDYRALLMSISPATQRVTDKRPQNFHYLGLIHSVLPRARIIHCRRNPVDTCLSIYFANFATQMDFAYARSDIAAYYREYLRLMAHWRSVLPADRFLEVDYEDLVADSELTTRELVEFCGLDWDDACLHPEHNRRAIQTASVWQARQPVYRTSVERWRRYEPWLGALRELLPPRD